MKSVAAVPRGPGALDKKRVLAGCRDRLTSFTVPAEVREIDEIPRTGSGKILRFRLPQRLAADQG